MDKKSITVDKKYERKLQKSNRTKKQYTEAHFKKLCIFSVFAIGEHSKPEGYDVSTVKYF